MAGVAGVVVNADRKLSLVVTDGGTGREYRIPAATPAYAARAAAIREATGLDAIGLRLRLLMTLAGGPEVEAFGLSYRLENAN